MERLSRKNLATWAPIAPQRRKRAGISERPFTARSSGPLVPSKFSGSPRRLKYRKVSAGSKDETSDQ